MSVTNNIIQTVVMGGAGIGTARAVAGSTRPALGAAASKFNKMHAIAPAVAIGGGLAVGGIGTATTERGFTPENRNVALGVTAVAGIAVGVWGRGIWGTTGAGVSAAIAGAGSFGAAFLVANGAGLDRPDNAPE